MEEKNAIRQTSEDEPFIDWPEWSQKTRSITPNSLPNVRTFLKFLGLHLWLDIFENRIRIDGCEEHAYLDDHVLSLVWGQANELGFRPSKKFMKDALVAIAAGETGHPLRDDLKGLQWDGIPRVEKLLINYANAEDNVLNRAIGKLLLVAMVRRVFQPGCKFDYMVILQGEQGCRKSLFCKELAGGPEFFEECLTLSASAKEILEQTAGKWVVEIAELSGLSAKDIEHQKSFITRTEDRARLSYGYFASSVPRQFVLIGTTNEEVFLRDATGNRRYLPVRVSDIDIDALRRDREQLLAEAIELEKTYGPLIMPQELSADLILRQNGAANIDDSYERLSDYIGDKLTANPSHEFPKDNLYAVIGVSTELGQRPLASHGKVIAKVTRDFGLKETKKGFDSDGKGRRVYVPEKFAVNLERKNTSLF
jgi:predicted P-loop ATPase